MRPSQCITSGPHNVNLSHGWWCEFEGLNEAVQRSRGAMGGLGLWPQLMPMTGPGSQAGVKERDTSGYLGVHTVRLCSLEEGTRVWAGQLAPGSPEEAFQRYQRRKTSKDSEGMGAGLVWARWLQSTSPQHTPALGTKDSSTGVGRDRQATSLALEMPENQL